METNNILCWWSLFLMFLLVSQSASQFQTCSEFKSPMFIQTIGTSVGTIRVPLSGAAYKSQQICEWSIVTNIADYGIRLDVKSSYLQGRDIGGECSYDYVDIFDFLEGDIVFMDRFCGREIGKSYLTTGNKMTIRFHSDDYQQFAGFEAAYQAVLAGSNKDPPEDENKKMLDMAVGIPVGILTLTVVVLISVFIVRYCRHKKAARSPPTTALTQNPAPARHGLPGGYHPSDTSTSAEPPDYYQDPRAGSSDFFPRNVPLQVIMSGAQEGYRNDRSVTPPPAYDSLDFDPGAVEHGEMPLTPPPYEMLVKQYMGPSNG